MRSNRRIRLYPEFSRKYSGKLNNSYKEIRKENPNLIFERPLKSVIKNEIVPPKLYSFLFDIYTRGPTEEGIFRKSSSMNEENNLLDKLGTENQIIFEEYDIFVVTSVFKKYLRSLPECVLISNFYSRWREALLSWNQEESFKKVLSNLPRAHYAMLKHVICVLLKIADLSPTNRMNSRNLSICIAASLWFPKRGISKNVLLQSCKIMAECVEYMLQNAVPLFSNDIFLLFEHKPTNITTYKSRFYWKRFNSYERLVTFEEGGFNKHSLGEGCDSTKAKLAPRVNFISKSMELFSLNSPKSNNSEINSDFSSLSNAESFNQFNSGLSAESPSLQVSETSSTCLSPSFSSISVNGVVDAPHDISPVQMSESSTKSDSKLSSKISSKIKAFKRKNYISKLILKFKHENEPQRCGPHKETEDKIIQRSVSTRSDQSNTSADSDITLVNNII